MHGAADAALTVMPRMPPRINTCRERRVSSGKERDPMTPDIMQRISKRQFDGQVGGSLFWWSSWEGATQVLKYSCSALPPLRRAQALVLLHSPSPGPTKPLALLPSDQGLAARPAQVRPIFWRRRSSGGARDCWGCGGGGRGGRSTCFRHLCAVRPGPPCGGQEARLQPRVQLKGACIQ